MAESGTYTQRDEPQFALFSGDTYYPLGGWEDYVDTFATTRDAMAAMRPGDSWAHIVDLTICEIVAKYERPFGWSS